MKHGISTLALVAGLFCGLATAQAQTNSGSTLGTGGASATGGSSNSSQSLSNSADGSWVIRERITPNGTTIYERGTGSISNAADAAFSTGGGTTGATSGTGASTSGSGIGSGSGSGSAANQANPGTATGRTNNLGNNNSAYGAGRGRYGNDAPGPEGISGGGQAPNDFRNDAGGDRFRRDRGHEYEWRGEGWDREHNRGGLDRHDRDHRDWNAGGDRD